MGAGGVFSVKLFDASMIEGHQQSLTVMIDQRLERTARHTNVGV